MAHGLTKECNAVHAVHFDIQGDDVGAKLHNLVAGAIGIAHLNPVGLIALSAQRGGHTFGLRVTRCSPQVSTRNRLLLRGLVAWLRAQWFCGI